MHILPLWLFWDMAELATGIDSCFCLVRAFFLFSITRIRSYYFIHSSGNFIAITAGIGLFLTMIAARRRANN